MFLENSRPAVEEGHGTDPMVMEPLIYAAIDIIVGHIVADYVARGIEATVPGYVVKKGALLVSAYSATLMSICELTQSSLSQGLYEEYIRLLQSEFTEITVQWP